MSRTMKKLKMTIRVIAEEGVHMHVFFQYPEFKSKDLAEEFLDNVERNVMNGIEDIRDKLGLPKTCGSIISRFKRQ